VTDCCAQKLIALTAVDDSEVSDPEETAWKIQDYKDLLDEEGSDESLSPCTPTPFESSACEIDDVENFVKAELKEFFGEFEVSTFESTLNFQQLQASI